MYSDLMFLYITVFDYVFLDKVGVPPHRERTGAVGEPGDRVRWYCLRHHRDLRLQPRRGTARGRGLRPAQGRIQFLGHSKIIIYTGIYIMQNTMVRGGGNGQLGKKIKLGVKKKMKRVKKKGGKLH